MTTWYVYRDNRVNNTYVCLPTVDYTSYTQVVYTCYKLVESKLLSKGNNKQIIIKEFTSHFL